MDVFLQRFLALMGCAIYFTFITISLANEAANLANEAAKVCDPVSLVTAEGKCNTPKTVEDNCLVKKLEVSYYANLVPNNEKHSKLSKRFQLCQDGGNGESEMPNVYTCSLKRGECVDERTIEFPSHSNNKNMKDDFEKGMPNGAHFADYLDIWMLGIDFYPHTDCIKMDADANCESNCNDPDKIILDKKAETTIVSTTTTTAKPKEDESTFSSASKILTTTEMDESKCNITWEPFEKAIVKFNNGEGVEPSISFAARVGFIEESNEQRFQTFVKAFLVNIGKFGADIPSVHEWMNANNDWILELPYNEFRYVPLTTYIDDDGALMNVTGETPMIFAVFRCPFPFDGAFAVAPTKYDEKLAGKLELSNIQHNWTNDFDYLFDCKHNSLIFDWDTAKFSVQQKIDGVRAKQFNLDVGVIFKKDMTISLTPARIEANKYMFGFSRPLRDQELNQTANNYKLVVEYGVFILPPDEAYKMKRSYIVTVYSKALEFDILTAKLPSNVPRTQEYWQDQDVTFYLSQENINCPDFNVTFPRINAFASVKLNNNNYRDFAFMFHRIKVYSKSGSGYDETMYFVKKSMYELYKQRKN